MTSDFITDAVKKLIEVYGAEQVRVAADSGRTLVRVAVVELYATAIPPTTPMLLVFDPAQPKPEVYVQPGQTLANGAPPKSTSVVLVGGESWLQFSFAIPWSEEHGIGRFIAAARQRFAQDA